MKALRNILVVVDPTRREQPAIQKAARLASRVDARVQLFACDTPQSREARCFGSPVGNERLPADLESLMDEWARPLRADGLEVTVECTTAKHVYPAVLKRACVSELDLLVKDTHDHSLAKRTFITNTDWKLVRECNVPLLLTKSTRWPERPIILAALDPTHSHNKLILLDQDLLEWGATLAAVLQGQLHGVHAYVPTAAMTAGSLPVSVVISPQAIADEERARRAELQALAASYGLAEQHLHVEFGTAVEMIPRVARDIRADIVTMGAISRSSAELLLIGHTAERVMERLHCDVLVVKPPDYAACLPF
jgi:universal stress protein E